MRPFLIRAVVAAGLLLATVLVIHRATIAGDSLARRFPAGLRVGYAVEAPYAFVDEYGTVTGESPEVARYVASRLGLNITFVQTDFGALIDQLDEGRYDVIAAGFLITPERARRVRFSRPTFQSTSAALVRRGNPLQLRSADGIRASGATVAVLATSVTEAMVRRAGVTDAHIVTTANAAAARRALESGRADVLLLPDAAVRWLAAQDGAGAFEVVSPFEGDAAAFSVDHGGFAFRLADDELADAWNGVLGGFVGTPEHLALIEAFGFTHHSLPSLPEARADRAKP